MSTTRMHKETRTLILLPLWASVLQAVVPPSKPAAQLPRPIEIRVNNVLPYAVVQVLRTQRCAAISFIAAESPRTVRLNLRAMTVAEALRQIVAHDPAYRTESFGGRDVLYPARPEFQQVIEGIDIQSMPRLDATYSYLDRVHKEVPALSNLVAPVVFGDSRHAIFSEKVSLRHKGRVIEQLSDLLGADPTLYFEFGKAMSGVPELVFRRVTCGGVQ